MLRAAHVDDVAAIVLVEQAAWPRPLAADEESIRCRLTAFPAGQLVAESQGQVVAYAAAQRVTPEFFAAHATSFDALTDHGRLTASCDPTGAIYQLIGVAVLPVERGSGLARALVDRQIEMARNARGVKRIVGFTRPIGFHKRSGMSMAQYVALRTPQGHVADPVLAFHLHAGAKLVAIQPEFRSEDYECGGYGVLIEYEVEDGP